MSEQKRRGNLNWQKGGPSPNPSGKRAPMTQARLDALTMRLDGWKNVFTGLGSMTHDKAAWGDFCADVVPTTKARELWRGDDIATRAVEDPVDEALREGWDLQIRSDADEDRDAVEADELSEYVAEKLEDLGFHDALERGMHFERAYGGGAIMLGVNDGASDWTKPLNLEKVRSLDWLTVLERDELMAHSWYESPREPKFRCPKLYQLNPYSSGGTVDAKAMTLVHESRFIVFPGVRVSNLQLNGDGWGDNIFTRIARALRSFGSTWGSVETLLNDFAQAVYKMKGLADIVAADRGDELKVRMRAMELSRSTVRATMIDAEDEFERKQTPVNGLADLLDRVGSRLAAAVEMPVTRLLGISPGGLNATGAADIEFMDQRTRRLQRRRVIPAVEQVAKVVMRLPDSPLKGKAEPDGWSVVPRPLRKPTELEGAQARKAQAETDAIYIDRQVVSPEEIAIARFGGDEYSFATQIDLEGREAGEPAAPAVVTNSAQTIGPDGELVEEPTAIELMETEARLAQEGAAKEESKKPREDAFDPKQPRSKNGMWVETGADNDGGSEGGGDDDDGGAGDAFEAATDRHARLRDQNEERRSDLRAAKDAVRDEKNALRVSEKEAKKKSNDEETRKEWEERAEKARARLAAAEAKVVERERELEANRKEMAESKARIKALQKMIDPEVDAEDEEDERDLDEEVEITE